MLSYEGIFLDQESVNKIYELEENKLEIVNDLIHCTFKYHPSDEEIFNEIVGKYFHLYLIGYACDGQNSGFLISLPNNLKKYYINYEDETKTKLKTPHITTSLKKGASASNTKNLDFKLLDKPVKVRGRFGFWIKEENREYVSFEHY